MTRSPSPPRPLTSRRTTRTATAIRNQTGHYTTPTPAAITADAADKPTITPGSFSIVDQPGPAAYPICGYSWILISGRQPSPAACRLPASWDHPEGFSATSIELASDTPGTPSRRSSADSPATGRPTPPLDGTQCVLHRRETHRDAMIPLVPQRPRLRAGCALPAVPGSPAVASPGPPGCCPGSPRAGSASRPDLPSVQP